MEPQAPEMLLSHFVKHHKEKKYLYYYYSKDFTKNHQASYTPSLCSYSVFNVITDTPDRGSQKT